MPKTNRTRFIFLSVFLTSFTFLAYEIILTRIYTITGWQNFSSLIISLALLSFGVSGSLIFLFKKKIDRCFSFAILTSLLLFPVSMCLGFVLFRKIPFNPFEIGLDPRQLTYLFLQFISVSIPFFWGASVIGMAFSRYPAPGIYFASMTGSGAGALFIILISYLLHPFHIITVITLLALLSTVIFSLNFSFKTTLLTAAFSFLMLFLFYLSSNFLQLQKYSQYKPLSAAMNLPHAQIISEKFSPLSLVQVVEADGLRSAAGLSLISPFQIPRQKMIFFDGSAMSTVTPFKGNTADIAYLDYTTSALPYHLLKAKTGKDALLIIGSGGGEGILKGIFHEFQRIDAVELDKNVISLMQNELAEFSGNIYNRSNVNIVNKEALAYVQHCGKTYNLIEISFTDAYNSASSGIYSLHETYLYSEEAIAAYLNCLKRNGVLAISRWTAAPPREGLKLLNICIRTLKSRGVLRPGEHMIIIRTLQTLTIVISHNPVTTEMILKTKQFCRKRLFDPVYFRGIKIAETGRYIKSDSETYHTAVTKLLSEDRERYIANYQYDISTATFNRPYFYNTFKLPLLKKILKEGVVSVPFNEWGYLILIIALLPVTVLSFAFVILPLLTTRKKNLLPHFTPSQLIYFALLGIAYFFIEMPIIQKMILFLSHPTYSLSVIISTLLISSGFGSYLSAKFFTGKKCVQAATVMITFITAIYLVFSDDFFRLLSPESDMIKILAAVLVIFPLGFFMGIPFPQGLQLLAQKGGNLIPLAWGINGFFSVISIITASLLSLLLGFNAVFIIACACYLAAGFTARYL